MGKYMRKAKTTGEVAVMDLSLGVRTRAKTLALQRQARLPASPPQPQPASSAPSSPGSAGYLQLRSRRLVKPPTLVNDSKRQKQSQNKEAQNPNPNSGVRVGSTVSGTDGSGQKNEVSGENKEEVQEKKSDCEENNNNNDINESKDLGIEASFGENVLDIEGRERSTRESTPCSLIRDPETIRTPGSTTRPTSSTETHRRIQNSAHRHIPTSLEMDEFFARAEEEQQRQFIEKYNFDPVNDKPLPGRYEWEKLDP
ncbi:hypothetical protein JCGZ_01136 [Jatropha curcas]|uniref:Cyclin-dependent kinase inhibitor domain-containing protein n=1 Tax=Jatropha curcas TaxID=180498 RepID=A0A067L5J1_JATCU|nr:cyclin-dependent kinase inhibitor 5 [Jatropha curcas]KDP39379.1 hypothetical protein JCGZ_01136 [Jatropha curcas]